MPEITVEISSKSEGTKNIATNIQSSSLTDLMSSLKQAKLETNSILTEIVEKRKSMNIKEDIKRSEKDEESDEENEDEEDDQIVNKKQKT